MAGKKQLYRIPKTEASDLKTYLFDGISPQTFAVLEKVAEKSIRYGLRAIVVARGGSVLKEHLVKTMIGDRFEGHLDWVQSNPLKELERKYHASLPVKPEDQFASRKRLSDLYTERERIRERLEEIKGEIYEASREVVLTHGTEGVFLEVNGRTELYHPSYSVSKKWSGGMIFFNRANYALPIEVP